MSILSIRSCRTRGAHHRDGLAVNQVEREVGVDALGAEGLLDAEEADEGLGHDGEHSAPWESLAVQHSGGRERCGVRPARRPPGASRRRPRRSRCPAERPPPRAHAARGWRREVPSRLRTGERYTGHVDPQAQVATADLAYAEHARLVDGHTGAALLCPHGSNRARSCVMRDGVLHGLELRVGVEDPHRSGDPHGGARDGEEIAEGAHPIRRDLDSNTYERGGSGKAITDCWRGRHARRRLVGRCDAAFEIEWPTSGRVGRDVPGSALDLLGPDQPHGSIQAFMIFTGTGVMFLYVDYASVYAAIRRRDRARSARHGDGPCFFAMYLVGGAFGPTVTGKLGDLFVRRAMVAAGVAASTNPVPDQFREIGLHEAFYVVPCLARLGSSCFWHHELLPPTCEN